MIFYITHGFKRNPLFLRRIEILPSLTISLYDGYKIDSIRFSWLSFTIGVGKP